MFHVKHDSFGRGWDVVFCRPYVAGDGSDVTDDVDKVDDHYSLVQPARRGAGAVVIVGLTAGGAGRAAPGLDGDFTHRSLAGAPPARLWTGP